jgi:NADH-quinone oxidoreductase subunit N
LRLAAAIAQWNDSAQPIYHGMMLFDNFSIAFQPLPLFQQY